MQQPLQLASDPSTQKDPFTQSASDPSTPSRNYSPQCLCKLGTFFQENLSLTWLEQCLVLMTTSFIERHIQFLTAVPHLLLVSPHLCTQVVSTANPSFHNWKTLSGNMTSATIKAWIATASTPSKSQILWSFIFSLCNFRIGCRQIPQVLLYYSDS